MCDEQFVLTATLDFRTVNMNTVLLDVTQGTRVFQSTVTYLKHKAIPVHTIRAQTVAAAEA